ncbi:MAG: ectonucleotide pyrophosphatase/phosphodiesterase [Acidobacteriota bacterium]
MRRVVLLVLSILFVSTSGSSAYFQRQRSVRPVPAKERIVVVISLDGFPAWTFEDPTLPTPTLRRLAREGAMAERMKISNPAVTWPNHTSMVTGVQPEKHGVLYNGILERADLNQPPKVEPWRDKAQMVRVPTVYDLAYKAGLTTAQVDWVAIQAPGTITWEFGERPNPQGAIEKEMVADGLITASEVENFSKNNSVWRDQVWTRAAIHILKKHKPNLLLFHLLNLDSVHHRYGPKSPAGYTAQAYIDSCVQQVLDALKSAALLERSTILIVSDHGFKTAKRTIRANAVLRELGLLRGDRADLTCDAYVVPEGGTAMAYVINPENRARLAPQMKNAFLALEGVARVVEPADFHGLGMPTPTENNQMADLVLVAKDGYSFSGASTGAPVVDIVDGSNPGNHGYLNTDPEMDAIFIAWGNGIRGGQRLGVINNVDLAPTIALLLGLKMEGIAGKELTTILK